MTREPSIHVTRTVLKAILKEAEIEGNLDDLVKFILTKASEHKLNTRKVLADSKKAVDTLTKTLRVSSDITAEMNKAILLVRKKLKHHNISTLRPGTKDYQALKLIAENGKIFYKTYFDKSEKRLDAFVTYIETYSSISKKWVMNFIPGSHDRICEAYEAKIKMAGDQNGELTNRLLKCYNQQVIEQAGTLYIDYSKVPEEYVKFINAAEICKTLNVPAEVYVKAQFERFSYFNSIPEPKDLISEKALVAIQKFVSKNPQYGKKAQINQDKINRLKNIGKKW